MLFNIQSPWQTMLIDVVIERVVICFQNRSYGRNVNKAMLGGYWAWHTKSGVFG